MKKWLYLISLMLFFVANTNAANSDFFGEREIVAAKGGMKAIQAGEYTITKTVANNLATRPYINSPSTITNIIKSGKRVPDAYFKGIKYQVHSMVHKGYLN